MVVAMKKNCSHQCTSSCYKDYDCPCDTEHDHFKGDPKMVYASLRSLTRSLLNLRNTRITSEINKIIIQDIVRSYCYKEWYNDDLEDGFFWKFRDTAEPEMLIEELLQV